MGRVSVPGSSGRSIEELAEALVRASRRNPQCAFAVQAIGPTGLRYTPAYSVKVLEDLFNRGLTASIIAYRIKFMEHDFPSSPTRPPKYVVYFQKPGRFAAHGFCTLAAARCFIELVLRDTPYSWADDNTIIADELTIQCSALSDVMESTGETHMPKPYPQMAAMISGRVPDTYTEQLPSEPEPSERPARKRRTRTADQPKAPQRRSKTEGLLGIQELSDLTELSPTAIRKTLRKNNISKPYQWDEATFEGIKALF